MFLVKPLEQLWDKKEEISIKTKADVMTHYSL